MIMILLRYRRTHCLLAGVVVCSALGLMLSGRVLDIGLNPNDPAVSLPVVEACGIVCAILAAISLRPRLWEWDHTAGGPRTAVPAATAAAGGIATAPLVVVISTASFDLPPSAEAYDVTTVPELFAFSALNAAFVAALVFATTPFVGPALAGAGGVFLWIGTAVVSNLVPASRHYTPITGLRFPLPGTWPYSPLAAVLVVATLAVTVHARTRGSTAFAQRLAR
ncbi:hypothetical protein [Saccharomonospora saliphila]|uniref:hypothetical protein n=1 Tax=Saccharomonospora saliphila TaxID=369829 RepID=UPI0003756C3D|nr:hypothetical protein [Saccharomonospora saliphila]